MKIIGTASRATFLALGISFLAVKASANPIGAKDDAKKLECRRPIADISTRIPPRKDCRTKAAWAEEAKAAEDNFKRRWQPPAIPSR